MANPTFKDLNLNQLDASKLQFLNCDFFSCLGSTKKALVNDSLSSAKPGQELLIHRLSKNVLFVVLQYLKCDELYSFVLTCAKLYNKITIDPFFKHVATDAYSGFFF